MSRELRWFHVQLALVGLSEKEALEALPYMQTQFEMRQHLRGPRIYWVTGTKHAVFETELNDFDKERAAGWAEEDLYEVTVAAVADTANLGIERVDVREIDTD